MAVPEGYRCPLCPDHVDPSFTRHPLVPVPLCDACFIELDHYALTRYPNLPDHWQQRAEVLEELTGRSWRDLRTEVVREQLEYWSTLARERTGHWFDVMRRNGWSQERCEELVQQQVRTLRAAYDDAEVEAEVERLIG